MNDFGRNLASNRVPVLLFLPMSSSSKRETFLFDFDSSFSEKKILNFIIDNAQNLDTHIYLLSLEKKEKLEEMITTKIKNIEFYLNRMKKNYEYANQSFIFDSYNFYENFKNVSKKTINLLRHIL